MFHDQGDVTIPACLTGVVNAAKLKNLLNDFNILFVFVCYYYYYYYFSGNNTWSLSLFFDYKADIYIL